MQSGSLISKQATQVEALQPPLDEEHAVCVRSFALAISFVDRELRDCWHKKLLARQEESDVRADQERWPSIVQCTTPTWLEGPLEMSPLSVHPVDASSD
jgi:hypothetical protein